MARRDEDVTDNETTAKGQRHPAERDERWEAGEYVLLAERHVPAHQEGDVELVRGDTVVLEEGEATRLGNAGAIAPVGSPEADEAEATPGTRSADVRTAPRFG
jgi:hypothetical protein